MSYSIHVLKIKRKYYKLITSGEKNFEIRKNDRKFKIGDRIYFTDLKNKLYHGEFVIIYILKGNEAESFGVQKGFVVMSIVRIDVSKSSK